MPSRIDEEPLEVTKTCIKQLSPNRWLPGPSLICERDISSCTYTAWFDTDGSESKVQ